MDTVSLSVIIITKNSAKTIARCLQSLSMADEIIVLDSGSEDDTVAICQQYATRVIETDWPGFGTQKNRAIDMTTNDWILSIDADEWLSETLQVSLRTWLAETALASYDDSVKAYRMQRRSSYLGRWIKHGDWASDNCTRLFNKHNARYQEVPVHEALVVKGRVAKLSGFLMHEAYVSLEQVLGKLNQYSSLAAKRRLASGQKSSLMKAWLKASWCFLRGYCFRLGFLDGREGLLLALTNAHGVLYRSLKMLYPSTQDTD